MTTPGNGAGGEPGGSAGKTPTRPDARFGEGLVRPEIVIVPAHPVSEVGAQDIVFEVREGADGAPVLPVFSSVRRLAEILGGAQPWVAFPLGKLREIAAAGQVHTILLDPEVSPGAWRWRYSDLESFQRSSE
jgi:SseB protein N-terminal domain